MNTSDGGTAALVNVFQSMRISSVAAIPFTIIYIVASSVTTGIPTFVLAGASGCVLTIFGRKKGLSVFWRFSPLLLLAAVFLTLIHGIVWSPFSIDISGLQKAATFLGRLVVIFAYLSLLAACINRDELFATLLLVRVPTPIIFGILRAFWILSRIPKRVSEIILAQRMRGIQIGGPVSRVHAISMSMHALINSMFIELEESVFSLVSRGIFHEGRKVSLTPIHLTSIDAFYAVFSMIGLALALVFDGKPQ